VVLAIHRVREASRTRFNTEIVERKHVQTTIHTPDHDDGKAINPNFEGGSVRTLSALLGGLGPWRGAIFFFEVGCLPRKSLLDALDKAEEIFAPRRVKRRRKVGAPQYEAVFKSCSTAPGCQ